MNQTTNQGYNLVENTDEIQTSLNAWNGNFNKIDADVTKLQTNIKVLEDNFDTATTSNSNNFVLEDSASGYNQGNIKIGDGPELEQDSPMVYKCNGTESGDYYFVYNSINYQFTMPTIEANDLLEFNTSTLVLSLNGTVIETTEASTGTLITLVQTPIPDYPQDITVVEGECGVGVTTENLFDKSLNPIANLGATLVELQTGVRVNVTSTGNNKYSAIKLKNPVFLLGKTLTISSIIHASSSNNGRIRFFWSNGNNLTSIITDALSNTGSQTFEIPSIFPSNSNGIAIVFSANASGTSSVGDYVDYTNVQLELGTTATSYVPHKGKSFDLTLPEGMFLGSIGTASNYIKGTKDNWKLVSGLNKQIIESAASRHGTISTDEKGLFRAALDNKKKGLSSGSTGIALSNYFKLVSGTSSSAFNDNDSGIWWEGGASSESVYLIMQQPTLETANEWLAENKPEIIYPTDTTTETQITDQTLISQLNNIIDNLQTYKGGTVVFTSGESLAPNIQFDYLQNPLSSIEARLDLLEA